MTDPDNYIIEAFKHRYGHDEVSMNPDGTVLVEDKDQGLDHVWVEIINDGDELVFMCEQTDATLTVAFPTEVDAVDEEEDDEADGPDYDRTHYPELATSAQVKVAESMIANGWNVSHFYEYMDDCLLLWMVARPKQTLRRARAFSHAYILPDGTMKRPKL